ncbi:hypothetical protein F511_42046 [Dorcoceras hygrometricum]|uniref:Uncharacterized protein n=1 Tax=Dorcoceras hygrometricum TaxID=472368 RepID=A0A2Z7ANV5_9LAMI|nr:hypothetical protein F511_42046 [Dorcoceras hygrometricum]
MAASFFVNALLVEFESVLAMEHTGMARMFKILEDTRFKGLFEASGSMKERCLSSLKMLREPNKNKEMKMEYLLLHDIVAKAPYAKAGSFDMVTTEKFDLMVVITAGLKVNWAHVLFQTLVSMVNTLSKQSQGFAVQVSVLLQNLVKAYLGDLVKLTRKVEPTVGKKNKKTEKVCQAGKKLKVVASTIVEAGSQAAPARSKSGTGSDEDLRPLSRLKKGGAQRKQIVYSSESEAFVSVPPVLITKKHRTKRTKKDRVASLEIIPGLTWEEYKDQLVQPIHSTPDKRTDQEQEHQHPEPTTEGQIEEIARTAENLEESEAKHQAPEGTFGFCGYTTGPGAIGY